MLKSFLFPKSRALFWGSDSGSDSASDSGGNWSDSGAGFSDFGASWGDTGTSGSWADSAGWSDTGGAFADTGGSFADTGGNWAGDNAGVSFGQAGVGDQGFGTGTFSTSGDTFSSEGGGGWGAPSFSDFGGGGFSSYGDGGVFSDPGAWGGGYSGVSYADAPFSGGWDAYGGNFNNAGIFGGPSYGGPFGSAYNGSYVGAFDMAPTIGVPYGQAGLNDAGFFGGPGASYGYFAPGGPEEAGGHFGAGPGGYGVGVGGGGWSPGGPGNQAYGYGPGASTVANTLPNQAPPAPPGILESFSRGMQSLWNTGSNIINPQQTTVGIVGDRTSPTYDVMTMQSTPVPKDSNTLPEVTVEANAPPSNFGPPVTADVAPPAPPATPAPPAQEAPPASLPSWMATVAPSARETPPVAPSEGWSPPNNPFAPSPPSMDLPPVEASKVGELVGTPGQVALGQAAAKSLLDMTPAQMNAALLEAAQPGSVQPPTLWDQVADFFSPGQAQAGDPLADIVKALRTGPFAAMPGNQDAQRAQQAARDQQWFNGGASPTDKYLADVYNRTPQKVDSTGDFTWKDAAAANYYGRGTTEYAIGGLHPDFKTVLEAMGKAMDRAGISWSMSAAYRDNARQAITEGFRASATGSMHGGTGRLGGDPKNPMSTYGKGQAVDLTGVDPGPQKSDNRAVWDFVDKYGAKFGISRNMGERDPPHVQPTDNFRQIAEAIRGGIDPMTAPPSQVAQAGRGPGGSRDSRSAFGSKSAEGRGVFGGKSTPDNPELTFYAPGTRGGNKGTEGGFQTKFADKDGKNIPHTLEDYAKGKTPYVTGASDPSRKGETITIPTVTFRGRDGTKYTLHDVPVFIHDIGGAFRGRPDKVDIATYDARGQTDKVAARGLRGNSVEAGDKGAQVAALPLPAAKPEQPTAPPQAAAPPVPYLPGITAPPVAPTRAAFAPEGATGAPPGLPGFLPTAPTAPSEATGSPPGLPGVYTPGLPSEGPPAGLPGAYTPAPPTATGSPPGLPGVYIPGAPQATGSPPGLPGLLDLAPPTPPTATGSPPGLPGVLPPAGLSTPLSPVATGSPPGLPGEYRGSEISPGEATGSPPGLPGTLPGRYNPAEGATGSPPGLPGTYNPAEGATGSPAGLPGDYSAYGPPGEPIASGSPAGLPGAEADYAGYGQEGAPVSAMPTAPSASGQFTGATNPAFKSEPMLSPSKQFDQNSKDISSKFKLSEADKKAGKDFLKGLTDQEKTAIVERNVPIIVFIERRAQEMAARGDFGVIASKLSASFIAGKAREHVEQNYPGGIAGLQRDATHRDMIQPTPSGIQSELARPGGAEVYDEQAGVPVAAMPTAPAAPPTNALPSWITNANANTTQPTSLADLIGAGFVPGGQFLSGGFTPGGGDFGGRGTTGTWDVASRGDDFNSRFGDWAAPPAIMPQAPPEAPPAVQQAEQEARSDPQTAQQIAQANPAAVQQIAQTYGVDIGTAAMLYRFLSMEEGPRQGFVPRGSNGSDFGRWPQLPTPDYPGQFAGLGREIVRQNYEAQNPINSLAGMMNSGAFSINPQQWDAFMANQVPSSHIEDRRRFDPTMQTGMR